MGLGGPVWHASCAPAGVPFGPATLERHARAALDGVGDPAAGEWTEWTGRAFHLRRRLTATEAGPIGEVVDIRGTDEAVRRWRAVSHWLPPALDEPL